jgi:hypothetical protein
MFTKEDYQVYFETIRQKEMHMAQFLCQFSNRIEDNQLKEALQAVLQDELVHTQLAAQLSQLL